MQKQATPDAKRSVLIVEDSIDFSNLLKFIVEDVGFEGVQFPVAGDDIVSWAKERKPTAILMDLALRRKEGMEYIEDLKADPATKKIPIIIISGRELGQKEVIELELRGVKYLRKGRVEMEDIKRELLSAIPQKQHAAPTEPPKKD